MNTFPTWTEAREAAIDMNRISHNARGAWFPTRSRMGAFTIVWREFTRDEYAVISAMDAA